MANWHRKQVSTVLGVVVIGLLLVGVVVLIPLLQQKQDVRSHAAEFAQYGTAGACASLANKSIGGNITRASCQSTSSPCDGGYVDNYCGGNNSYKCCVVSKACAKIGGKCITKYGTQANPPGGNYVDNLCPGGSSIKCYVPPATIQPVRSVNNPIDLPTATPTPTYESYYDAGKPGLKSTRYNNGISTGSFSGVGSRTGNANVDVYFNGVGGPVFSNRWEGYLYPPYTGYYKFHVSVDDGARMWIQNDKSSKILVIDKWTTGAKEGKEGDGVQSVHLTRGNRTSIKVEYFNSTGTAYIHLFWICPLNSWNGLCSTTDWKIVPTRQLAPLN